MAVNDYIALAASSNGDTGRVVPQVDPTLYFPQPELSTFTIMTDRMGGRSKVGYMEHIVQEEWDPVRDCVLTAASASNDTTLDVDDASPFIAGDLLMAHDTNGAPLGEQIKVSSISSNVLTVSRGYGGTAIALTAGMVLRRLNTFTGEAGVAPSAKMRATNRVTQYCSAIIRTVEITEIMRNTDVYGTPEEMRIDAQAVRNFAIDREETLLYSMEKKDTSAISYGGNSYTGWATKGLRWHAADWNRFDAGGTLTHELMVQAIMRCNRFGGVREKTLIVSQAIAAGIAKWGLNMGIDRRDYKDTSLGFNITQLSFPGLTGVANIVVSHSMEIRNEILIADFTGLQLAEFIPLKLDPGPSAGSDQSFHGGNYGIQTPGTLTKKWSMNHHFGLKCTKPWAQGVITNVDRVVA